LRGEECAWRIVMMPRKTLRYGLKTEGLRDLEQSNNNFEEKKEEVNA